MKHIDSTDLTAKWILRTHNKHADHLSRIPDQDNLGISLAVFHFFMIYGGNLLLINLLHIITHIAIDVIPDFCVLKLKSLTHLLKFGVII